MNRKRSRLENMFHIEVHRDDERENHAEVVQEENEPQERQEAGMSSTGNGNKFPWSLHSSYLGSVIDNQRRTLRSNSLESNSPAVINSQGVMLQ